jgi:spore germination protein YaaH
MSRQRTRHFAVALVLSAVLAAASAVPAVAGFAAPTRSAEVISKPSAGIRQAPIATVNSHTSREVFGFALASSLSDPTVGYPSWNFDLLSTVSYFGVHVDTTGHFASDNGWTVWSSSALAGMVSIAHQHGTRVLLSVILQDFSPNTPSMCAGLNHADTTVAQAVSEVAAKHVDGVNIDYEGLDGACGSSDPYWAQHALNTFAQKMRAGLGSSLYLSIDTYAGAAADPYGFFDVAGLANYVDSEFVMAYDMEYSNYASSPTYCPRFCLGPTSPLTGYRYNDSEVLSRYISIVPAGKIILGVPYYGRKACVSNATSPNQYPTSSVVADSYLDASGEAAFHEVKAGSYVIHRDTNSGGLERWDTWYNTTLNCTRELYWDDATSLGKKYDLVNADGIRGVGLWNLNYGGGAPELWSALATHFAVCSAARSAFSPVSPANAGTPVTVTGIATGCPNPLYEFWMRPAGSAAWQMVQGYSPSSTYRWNTTGAAGGTVYLGVWARDAASTATYDAYSAGLFTVRSPCTSAGESFSPASPALRGASVTVTSSAAGCPNPLYEFWMRPAGSSTWQLAQGYSTSPSYHWNTNGAAAGVVYFGVWARDAASTAAYDTYAAALFTLSSACASASASYSPASPAFRGTAVTVTGSAAGCPNPLYEFWMRPSGSSTWQIVQGYSTSSTYHWNTSATPAGLVYFGVWARDSASKATFDAYAPTQFTLSAPCTSVTATFSPPPPLAHSSGATVVITGSASGCLSPVYEFWILPAGSTTWRLVQGYSTSATYRWNTSGAPAGAVRFGVWVRDAAGTAAYDTYISVQFNLT